MTFAQFINKWIGKKADFDGYFQGQCVDLFRYWCEEVLEIPQPDGVWGASNFWDNYNRDPVLFDNFIKIENTADFTPKEGDAMVWKPTSSNPFGHIGMPTGENTGTQYFKSFDQNWSQISYCEIVNHNYNNVYGVLRARNYQQGGNMVEVPAEDFEKLVTKADKYDKFVEAGYKTVEDVFEITSILDQQLKSCQNKLEECQNSPITPEPEDIPEFIQVGDTVLRVNGVNKNGVNYGVYQSK